MLQIHAQFNELNTQNKMIDHNLIGFAVWLGGILQRHVTMIQKQTN